MKASDNAVNDNNFVYICFLIKTTLLNELFVNCFVSLYHCLNCSNEENKHDSVNNLIKL